MSRIAAMYPYNMFAGQYVLGGYKSTLERMGHEVVDCPFPGNYPPGLSFIDAMGAVLQFRKSRGLGSLPDVDDLEKCDLVIVFYAEYTQAWIEALYGIDKWLTLKVPVIARYDESMDRPDLKLAQRIPFIMKWAKFHSFPAVQDAKKYNGQWLPFGADTTVFTPRSAPKHCCAHCGGFDARCNHCGVNTKPPSTSEKKYPLGFIGTMYDRRRNYIEKLAPYLPDGTYLHTPPAGQVVVADLSGVREQETCELMAENYRQIKVFLCLPPMSHLIVAKIPEIMACGTFVMYPLMPGGSSRNNVIFEDRKHLVYYDPGYLKTNAEDIMYFLEHDEEREAIARAGCELVHREHTLEKMLAKLISLADNYVRPAEEPVSENVLPT